MSNSLTSFLQWNFGSTPANTPQSMPLKGQVPNSAGGFSFAVSDWTRLQRFLVLGH